MGYLTRKIGERAKESQHLLTQNVNDEPKDQLVTMV